MTPQAVGVATAEVEVVGMVWVVDDLGEGKSERFGNWETGETRREELQSWEGGLKRIHLLRTTEY